jgi:hypothetical protein
VESDKKQEFASQLFGNGFQLKLCTDLDEDCFTQEWTQAEYNHCAAYDRCKGFCPFEKR